MAHSKSYGGESFFNCSDQQVMYTKHDNKSRMDLSISLVAYLWDI